MTEYVLACTNYMHHMNAKSNLGVEGMEAPLWQIEGITSGTHCTPEQLRLPFHTSKCSQCTVHNMRMKNMVGHGNKGRVTNPSLAGDVEITVSECNRLYLILVVLHRRRARMQIDFLEEVLICLEVASPSMETQDAHEHILVVGKV